MALVTGGFELNVTLLDNGLNTGTLSYKLTPAADFDEATTAAADILARLALVTQAEIKGYTVGERFIENALAVPVSNVHIENRAIVVCQINGDPLKKVSVVIPAPSPDIFSALSGDGANQINPLHTDLVNYIDIWRVTGALATISDGEFIADGLSAIVRGYRTHRKSSYG